MSGCCRRAVLSSRFESWWHPGTVVEQVTEGVECADAPFGGGGQVGLDDGEVGELLAATLFAHGPAALRVHVSAWLGEDDWSGSRAGDVPRWCGGRPGLLVVPAAVSAGPGVSWFAE